ncbi:MAG: hypothetical protein GAK30_00750 [Paracidovorax wautersii]|uniref:Uncharacterized protein n=1 Tax=Paracidovorax wautersii TaxID=1177982 RepID=A0A7V8JRA9_9BURK|nr:MAG: hypothetical protein GAK30_00750 [Paracidovorax wautersii]
MARHASHRLHQAARAAAVDVAAVGFLEHGPQIERASRIAVAVVDADLGPQARIAQFVQEGRGLGMAAQVVELPGHGRQFAEGADHGQDGCDADAAGDEGQAAGALDQRKGVVGLGDRQGVAHTRLVDQADRAAAPLRLALDGDDVAVAFFGAVAQRVLAQRAAGHLHLHVRAGRERRQFEPLRVHQLERADALRGVGDGGDAQRHPVGGVMGRVGHGVVPAGVPGRSDLVGFVGARVEQFGHGHVPRR